jgi:hypothetical protein
MKKKTILMYSTIIVVIVSLVIGVFAYTAYNRKSKVPDNADVDYTIEYAALLGDFTANQQKANSKYLNKILKVTGTVKAIDDDGNGNITIVLGDSISMNAIRCAISPTVQVNVTVLKPAQAITITGVCTGFNSDELLGSDIILNRCVIN